MFLINGIANLQSCKEIVLGVFMKLKSWSQKVGKNHSYKVFVCISTAHISIQELLDQWVFYLKKKSNYING